MPPSDKEGEIRAYYRTLWQAWGPQHWWPARTRFEVIVGAYLTQNTAWTNVEKALANLREQRLLTVSGIRRARLSKLERLIRPSGYFRQKAKKLKRFVAFLDSNYGGSLPRMLATPTNRLREQLLALNGAGPETADSILLYAGDHPVFVVDAYTRRILERHQILPADSDYEEIRRLFERSIPPLVDAGGSVDPPATKRFNSRGANHPPSPVSTAPRPPLAQLYNEMHGLIVGVGKNYCRKSQPRCDECPLRKFLPASK